MTKRSAPEVRNQRGQLVRNRAQIAGVGQYGVSKHRAWQQDGPDQRAADRWDRAQEWSAATGRPLPPAMRERPDRVSNAVPMSSEQRTANYASQDTFTPAQRRRRKHKLGHQAAVRRKHKASA